MTLSDILRRLSEEERNDLRRQYDGNASLVAMLVREAIDDPELTAAAFIKAHRTTAFTFNKTQSQAIDQVYEYLKRRLNNPYDPILLVQKLLLRGLPRQARKLYNELEKEYSREMRYAVLDALYHEGVRIAYDGGDLVWLRELERQVNENSAKLCEYNRLDKALIRWMLELERARTRMDARRAKQIDTIYRDAVRAGHPVLMINALYCRHIYYLRHRFDLPRALDALADIVTTAEEYRASLDEYTSAIATANYVSFLCAHAVDADPEPYFPRVDVAIARGSTLGPVISHFERFQYFLFTDQSEKATREYDRLTTLSSDNRFHPLTSVAAAWLALARDDRMGYSDARQAFYAHPSYRDFPEHEFDLRAIDLILSLRHDEEDAIYKAEALRKFSERRFQEPRMTECRRFLRGVASSGRRGKRAASGDGEPFMLRSLGYLLCQARVAG